MGIGLVSTLCCQGYDTSSCLSGHFRLSVTIRQDGIYSPIPQPAKKDS